MAYIDREKFLKKSVECFGRFGVLVKAIEEIANKCTEEDVVEVVRCKDCIYNEIGSCTHSQKYDEDNYRADYFCADGTPKERGEDNAQ